MSGELIDLEIAIRPNQSQEAGKLSHSLEAKIDGRSLWQDTASFDPDELDGLDTEPEKYGERLRQLVFPEGGQIARAYDRALGQGQGRARVRIYLDPQLPPAVQLIRWERMFVVPGRISEPLSTANETPFARFIPVPELAPTAQNRRFHLLVVVGNPTNLSEVSPIEVDKELRGMAAAFSAMSDPQQFKLTVLTGRTQLQKETSDALEAAGFDLRREPSTLENIGLVNPPPNGIHFICHGKYDPPKAVGRLYLETSDGSESRVADDKLALLKTPSLQLIFLQACESGVQVANGGFAGLAAKLVMANVPAVVGMQEPVVMEDAQALTRAFYQSLVKQGQVDVAMNAGRQAIRTRRGGKNDKWHVPALYMSRADGRLWNADVFAAPLARRVAEWERRQEEREAIEKPMPLQAARKSGPEAAPIGDDIRAILDTFQPQAVRAVAEHVFAPGGLVILTGPRGAGKSAILDMLFRQFSLARQRDACALVPVRLQLSEISSPVDILKCALDWLRQYGFVAESVETLADQELVLLVDGEEDVLTAQRNAFMRAVKAMGKRLRVVVSVDELTEGEWVPRPGRVREAEKQWNPAVISTKPMTQAQIALYLQERGKTDVAAKIQALRCWDLAGEGWVLRRLVRTEAEFENRAAIYRWIADEQFEKLCIGGLTRSSLERALKGIAWEMQMRRTTTLTGSALYEILADARAGREYRLEEIKSTLIAPCKFLRPSGEDGVKFSYAGMQAYYAALHLQESRNHEQEIEDVIARLGRLKYVRHWQETLVVLAGLMEPGSFEKILGRMLAGSSGAGAGELVYLASQCYMECGDNREGFDIRELLMDTLMWRAHPMNDLPVSDRQKAIRWLSEMYASQSKENADKAKKEASRRTAEQRGDPDGALRLLIELGCEQVSKGWDEQPRYEFSSLRLEALNVLLADPKRVADFVAGKKGHVMTELVEANESLRAGDPKPMEQLLFRGKDDVSPLAVFALGLSGHKAAASILSRAFLDPGAFQAKELNREVRWAVAEMLPRIDPRQTLELAAKVKEPDALVVYMIGRLGSAGVGAAEKAYLQKCLESGQPRVIGQTLRTFALLRDLSYKAVCEHIVAANWEAVNAEIGFPEPPDPHDVRSLQHAAMEALRSIGDQESIRVLQKSWQKLPYTLSVLTYSVAEEIFWRMQEGTASTNE